MTNLPRQDLPSPNEPGLDLPSHGVVIVVPVLNRPHKVAPLLTNIRQSTPEPFRVLWVVDPDDEPEMRALAEARVHPDEVLVVGGSYGRKINLGITASTEPLIFPAADDLFFEPRWLEEAVAKMNETVCFVGTQDLGHRLTREGQVSPHPLVTREYVEKFGTIDEPGKLYCELYNHMCVDREAVETAKYRGVWDFSHKSVIEHMHPAFGKAPDDATYRKSKVHWNEDLALLRERRRLWAT